MEPAVLKLPEVAEMLRVHRQTMYRLIKKDRTFPAFKIGVGRGSDWRVMSEQLDIWMKSQTKESSL